MYNRTRVYTYRFFVFSPPMKNYFIRLSNQHETISKYILIFLTISLIVIALPKETQFNYTFRKGKPWAFDNLLAPFDFAINKTEAELNEEKAGIMKGICVIN